MKEEDIDILEFLISSDFDDVNYSRDQFVYFLKKYQKYYKLLNAKYHGVKNENERIKEKTEKLEAQLTKERRSRGIDKAKIANMNKELKKKLTWKERFKGKLIGRFDPDNI
jgi:predicted Rossmann fold nucleotide-binding protein DprA/Smf involved in DNA uptake